MTSDPRKSILRSAHESFHSLPKGARWGIGVLAFLLILVSFLFAGSYFLDEPLRRSTEERMNRRLTGYSVRIQKQHIQLVGLTMVVHGLNLYQQANPKPPVAYFPAVRFRIHWIALLRGSLVGEVILDKPEIWINLPQISAEAESKIKLKDRGWQDAVAEIYPFKINRLRIRNGTFTYIDKDPDRPLRLSGLDLEANNIRNVLSPKDVYPSSFNMKGRIFDTGKGTLEGKADFLSKPHLGFNARVNLENVPLDYFKPIIERANLSIRKGIFDGSGRIEYSPDEKVAHLKRLAISGIELDYVHRTDTKAKRRAEEVAKAVKESPKSEMLFRIDEVKIKGTFGMKNAKANPQYYVYLSDADIHLANLSNKFSQGPAQARLSGKFMGSGETSVTAVFRAEEKGPDLDLAVRIDDARMRDMNDLFKAYGNFDVSEGMFSFISELQIRNNRVSGYMKPFFKDMKVYDRRDDQEKSRFRKLYEMLVGGVSKLLESRRRGEVAARAEISGPVENPEVSSWQVLGSLIENAFFRTILPQFEREVSRAKDEKE